MSSSGETTAVSMPSCSSSALSRTAGSTSCSVMQNLHRGARRCAAPWSGGFAAQDGDRVIDDRLQRGEAVRTPLGEPGRLTMSVRLTQPATPRDSAARGNAADRQHANPLGDSRRFALDAPRASLPA